MLKNQLFIAAALFVGVAIGYFAKSTPPNPVPETAVKPTVSAVLPDKGADASAAALRARVAELEKQLEKRSASAQEVKPTPAPSPAAPRENWRDRMARMEKENPARYAQMTNSFAQVRRRRLEFAQSRIDFLSSVDTSRMSASARKTHEDLQELIEKREELESKMQSRDLSDEERRALFTELYSTAGEMHELNLKERDNLLMQTAEAIGLEGDDAAEMTATIKGIIEATEDMRWNPRRNRRR